MVTKCDLVEGSPSSSKISTAEGRAQVWGVTFRLRQTVANKAPQEFPGSSMR